MAQLKNKIKISTTLTLLSGLHIGENRDRADIGGIDNPVIRRKDKDQQPYIPGSSLKGKMRSLLEQIGGIAEIGGGKGTKFSDKSRTCQNINIAFGFADDDLPSRLIFRDSYMTQKSVEELKASEYTDMPFTESKSENTINRVTGKADNPRTQERIPAGTQFTIEVVVNDFNDEKTDAVKSLLIKGIEALNNDYLGGSGTRGYGHVKIDLPNDETTSWKEEVISF
ncbi:MAG: type III-A CRISPR-associated RAMP protein Csm3 [Bacteroidetes bacterium]|nr:type III-A CRISPR-associated RAMP protein Csm3 [Bacteroidota bacterium]